MTIFSNLKFPVVHYQHLNLNLGAQIKSSAFILSEFVTFSFGNQKLKKNGICDVAHATLFAFHLIVLL